MIRSLNNIFFLLRQNMFRGTWSLNPFNSNGGSTVDSEISTSAESNKGSGMPKSKSNGYMNTTVTTHK